MKILVSWLRDFVAVDVTVQELADALTMRGFEVSDIEPAPSRVVATGEDAVLDLEITTNRPDCMGVRGVAREVSTIYETELQPLPALPTTPPNTESASTADVSVVLEDSELCPRYVASVADVTVGPSPGWLAARLEATGVRSVNNVVDATNYVMLELGHPLHAFDLAKLEGAALRIRTGHHWRDDSHARRRRSAARHRHARDRRRGPPPGPGRCDGRRRIGGCRDDTRRGAGECVLLANLDPENEQACRAFHRCVLPLRAGY